MTLRETTAAVPVRALGLAGGTDQESIAWLRQCMMREYLPVPDGGNADDYVTWGLEVPSVTRARCAPN
ncbi:baseplate J/gp47 family protein [Burkholderia sp. RF7-non_BP1]|uniref:baseplate J/gp47 family protein n=1 Tax=unclassified Burkholderia TaxID=2613784 RepID=UPI000751EE7E